MIVLDTNVLSELMKSQPDKSVVRWIGKHQVTSLFITTLTQAKILYGLEIKIPVYLWLNIYRDELWQIST